MRNLDPLLKAQSHQRSNPVGQEQNPQKPLKCMHETDQLYDLLMYKVMRQK